jgi:hypothetical protein
VLNVNYSCRRIDSRFLLPSRRLLPHVNCYPAAELRGGGGDGKATEHGDTARTQTGGWRTLSGGGSVGTPPDPRRLHYGDQLSRKHALRVLHRPPFVPRPPRPRKRIYDEAVRQALALLWEAANRICGKRLKALLPVLIESMEHHGHLRLDPVVRSALLDISAATIDRLLRPVREASGRIRRQPKLDRVYARYGVASEESETPRERTM